LRRPKIEAVESAAMPCDPADISIRVNRIVQLRSLQRENAAPRERLARQAGPAAIRISAGMTLSETEKVLIAATI
jgi:hypothetical protein